MSFNLLDAAKGLFTNELVGKASSYLGESESGVTKALSGIVPIILGGLADKTSTHEGAITVANAANDANNAGFLGNLGGFFSNESNGLLNKGANLLGGLFGDSKSNIISTLISNFSGVKSSTSSALLSMAVPSILGLLGKHASSNNLNAGGLASLFSSQKNSISNAIPAGLNVSNVFSSFGNQASSKVEKAVHTTAHYAEEKASNSTSGLKLLLPILLLCLLAAGIWWFTKDGCNKKVDETIGVADTTKSWVDKITTATTTVVGKVDSLSGDFIYDLGETATIDLPNNVGQLVVGKNSTEYKLVQFLNDKNAVIDTAKGNWFEFTNVRFKTGGSELTETSVDQLKNLVTIAKAYPNAIFKFGGYTDNTGDKVANITLSQKRSDAVVAMVKKLGIPTTAIDGSKGYGEEWPIADNTTAEGKAQNRRVAVNVKAK